MSSEEDQPLEQRMRTWWNNNRVCQYEAMPALFVFTIWLVRNKAIFKDTLPSFDLTVNLLLQKVMEHHKEIKPKPKRVLKPPRLDKNTPWAFFDGASQGEPLLGGVGGILHMNEMSKAEILFAPG